MKRILPLLICVASILNVDAQTFITHTNVVDVISSKIIPDQTVVIQNGIIVTVDKSSNVKVPANATVVGGKDKYLMPGLVDAHVHFFQTGGLYTRPDAIDLRKYKPYDQEIKWAHAHFEDFLRRYLAAGITTVIDPGSTANFLIQRDTFKTKTYAPDIYMTGPLLTTYEPDAFKKLGHDEPFYFMETDEGARTSVEEEITFKPDFIKIWYITDDNVDSSAKASSHFVKAVIDEAHKYNLKVAVHATELTTARLAIEDGADYLVHSVDDKVIDDSFIQLLKEHHVVLCPTLQVADNYLKVFTQAYQPTSEDKKFANEETINTFSDLSKIPDTSVVNRYMRRGMARWPAYKRADSIMNINLMKLANAGVTIATGTDAGNIGTLHASSYFTELRLMKDAGMSIAQILQSSTINGAKALGKENEFGSIEKGKRANMLLLEANPLESLDNWQKTSLIINKGEMFKPGEIIK